jgi:hypothetical protein
MLALEHRSDIHASCMECTLAGDGEVSWWGMFRLVLMGVSGTACALAVAVDSTAGRTVGKQDAQAMGK